MAEQGPCPGLDASLRSEDLPLGSEVMAQLYASLRRSRQAERDACSQLRLPNLDALTEELSRTLSAGVEASARRMGTPSAWRSNDSESDSTTALLATRPLQELSPPGSVCGLEDLFPRYVSLRLGTPPAPAAEPLLLKEALAKERARRKHCEWHIQGLQSRVLELQQQLDAAISADMKKDSMIEQLDKTLAKVVEGRNRQEAERMELLRGLQAEKEAAQQALGEQRERAAELEARLEEALSREQQAGSRQREEAVALVPSPLWSTSAGRGTRACDRDPGRDGAGAP